MKHPHANRRGFFKWSLLGALILWGIILWDHFGNHNEWRIALYWTFAAYILIQILFLFGRRRAAPEASEDAHVIVYGDQP